MNMNPLTADRYIRELGWLERFISEHLYLADTPLLDCATAHIGFMKATLYDGRYDSWNSDVRALFVATDTAAVNAFGQDDPRLLNALHQAIAEHVSFWYLGIIEKEV